MEKYCCFNCPKKDYSFKSLDDLCPDCNKPYRFPLEEGTCPINIGDWLVLKPLGRGYYGSTYIVEKKTVIRTKKMVLKVVPISLYTYFKKNFSAECQNHAIAAEGTQHIVGIDDVFDVDIIFGENTIPCHVAILDYIEGDTLEVILNKEHPIKASSIGQIAIDLLKILSELQNKQLFHNDLHPGNIIVQVLKEENKRLGELDESIKAVAIDFGSLNTKTQSGDESGRTGDLHWIASILNKLSQKILDDPHISEERDYRLASLLEERAHILFPRTTSLRTYDFEEVVNQIKNAFIQVDSPWRQTLSLRSFKDSYNAQTLAPWFVPSLLVDDDDKWISEISNKGPQVITGMRGCGKTMLLRALQFHARAIPIDGYETNNSGKILQRLGNEGYIGLYVSCTRLLDRLGAQDQPLFEPFTRLFVAYCLETINALRHLRELDKQAVNPTSFENLSEIVSEFIEGAKALKEIKNEHEIERFLKGVLNSLSKGEGEFTINSNPAIAFPALANVISKCSPIWANQYIFFLLDDVSTRFLIDENIITLVSSLLFQNEFCAFKFTTEAQTLEMVIKSPGNIETARIGRDYSVFDLGREVNNKIHSGKKEGIKFVEKILYKRAQFHSGHPKNFRPTAILGDSSLNSIAKNIAKPGKASDKKNIYHGITAIAGVCVGDIGDVITLYEMMLKRRGTSLPISQSVQNECYLDLSNSRLFDIDRRESRLFDFAESFAEASHFLLVQSFKQNSGKARLRQYSSIFINVSTGDINKQHRQVRELIDAGIFNFSGGPQASRTNRQGVNPQQQFKLTYRKLYGLNKHIGLAQSDRFELSGEALEEWLNFPKNGKEILIRNLKHTDEAETDGLEDESVPMETSEVAYQASIFDSFDEDSNDDDNEERKVIEKLAREKVPNVSKIPMNILKGKPITTIVTSLGFEECTLKSTQEILTTNPQKATLIKFNELGKSKEILKLIKGHNIDIRTIDYSQAISKGLNNPEKDTLFDITGLPKSIIFNVIRNSLLKHKKVLFVYTKAQIYYPLEEDIERLLGKSHQEDQTVFLESLNSILKGEKGPYSQIPLLPKEINPSSRRVLIAFSSPKHERLYSLLDEREYDKIHIITPTENNPRNRLAKIAAEVAVRKFNHAEINEFGSNDLQELMEYLSIQYQNYFVNQNFSFEIAITGSKLQTVAAAAMSSMFKVSQCWYLQPSEWDAKRFTSGFEETQGYELCLIS